MALIPEGTPAPTPAPTPTPTPPSAGDPPTGDPPADNAAERPEYLPEALWKDGAFDQEAFDALNSRRAPAEDLPDAPEGYVIPAIEGFDAEAAAASPLFAALRKGAHANGMGQAQFDEVVKDYVAGEVEKAEAYEADQLAKLGKNAEPRLKALGTWLDASMTPEQAAAVRALATNADAVAGLEAVMNARAPATPRDPPPDPVVTETEADIRKLMQSKEYRGKPNERDPAVVKRVDDWFAKNKGDSAR